MRRKIRAPGRCLHAQAAYSVTQLVALTGLTRFVVRGLLESYGVQFLRSGRKMLVPLTEIEDKVPLLWKNLWRMEGLRAEGVVATTPEEEATAPGSSKMDP